MDGTRSRDGFSLRDGGPADRRGLAFIVDGASRGTTRPVAAPSGDRALGCRSHSARRCRSLELHAWTRHRGHAARTAARTTLSLVTTAPGVPKPLKIGIGGPVGSGKTALVETLARRLHGRYDVGVITNDIYTQEDAQFLIRRGVLPEIGRASCRERADD